MLKFFLNAHKCLSRDSLQTACNMGLKTKLLLTPYLTSNHKVNDIWLTFSLDSKLRAHSHLIQFPLSCWSRIVHPPLSPAVLHSHIAPVKLGLSMFKLPHLWSVTCMFKYWNIFFFPHLVILFKWFLVSTIKTTVSQKDSFHGSLAGLCMLLSAWF